MNFEKLYTLAQKYYTPDDPGHDFAHVKRVIATAKKLGQHLGAKMDTLIPAALLHDVVNVPKNHPKRSQASELAAKKAHELLKECEYPQDIIDQIKQVIIEHSFSRGDKPSSLESQILQDADRMDALGAIGILRTASVSTKLKSSFYCEDEPLVTEREFDDRTYMLDHFYTKLYLLPDMMNTTAGKEEATRRVKFMEGFVQELLGEIMS